MHGPEDISPPSQFLLPDLDNSFEEEDTCVTEVTTQVEVHDEDKEEEVPPVNSEASALVDTNEFLEFIDAIDMGEMEETKQSNISDELKKTDASEEVENPKEQTLVDPKSESQLSSFMSYHEGESSSLMDPCTEEQKLSKSSESECTVKTDSGTDNQTDISSHDSDIIAYEAKESSSPSIEISSPNTAGTKIEKVAESSESEDEPETAIEVEVVEPRRSGRDRVQTKLFGNPLLYKITCRLTPRFFS